MIGDNLQHLYGRLLTYGWYVRRINENYTVYLETEMLPGMTEVIYLAETPDERCLCPRCINDRPPSSKDI